MYYHVLAFSIFLLISICLYFYIINKTRVINWVDRIIIFLPSILSIIIILCNLSITNNNLLDVRYVDKIAKEIRKYSYLDKKKIQREEYTLIYSSDTGNDEEREIEKDTYYYFAKKWEQKPKSYVDSFGRKITVYKWNSKTDSKEILTYTTTELFTNYFNSVLFENISNTEANSLGLFKYHYEINKVGYGGLNEPGQSLLYGISMTDSIKGISNYLSSLDSNFRPLILCWYGNKDKAKMIQAQRTYWKGGKDNEIIFCVCLNNKEEKKILWSGSFSWANDKKYENYVINNHLIPGTTFDIYKLFSGIFEGYKKGLWNPSNNHYYITKEIFEEYLIIILSSSTIILLNIISSIRILKRKKKK